MRTTDARRKAVDIHSRDAKWFDDQYNRGESLESSFKYGRKQVERLLMDTIAQLPAGAHAIDVGCGTGELVMRMRARGVDAVGLEPAAGMRAIAESRLPAGAVIDGSALALPFADGSADFITAIEVLRYLDRADNDVALREIARVLRPGGLFFGTFVNLMAWDGFALLIGLRRARRLMFGHDLECHTEFETPVGLARHLKRAGFREVTTKGAMFAPLRIAYRVDAAIAAGLARFVEPVDSLLTGAPLTGFAGHLVAVARRD